ncbi:pentatricopeptide repeat-containing protein At4g02750-like [Selaginella moellendorffii]|uniref:pentatricopeptide repeat-containing protein At4g02750-like n=1 Tax=Selaginella moellendorffii TaxID=88036 RepID=UPI000D1CBED0|nr:pentatricopeptide repeat-containing protein At4g02750-like [Selaginella moellendorffii]|eukprot:XP_024516764.1 pentatricopeptide repeat-containing protein At4g02750-like [Selaginella moellendorffii]
MDVFTEEYMIPDAKDLFDSMQQQDVVSWTKLLGVYARSGDMNKAVSAFNLMPARDAVASTVLLRGFVELNMISEAEGVFQAMPEKDIHAHTVLVMASAEVGAATSLQMEEASKAVLMEKDPIAWNALIAANTRQGDLRYALKLFESMQLYGVNPDGATMICLLQTCSHRLDVQTGREVFRRMGSDFAIPAERKHYCCMVDLLARAGHLDDAEELVCAMPFIPSAAEWNALLGACRSQGDGNVRRAERVAKKAMELNNEASYVLMGNIYSGSKNDQVDIDMALESLREKMREQGLTRKPAISVVTVGKETHRLMVDDKSHPNIQEINAELATLTRLLKNEGYVPRIDLVFSGKEEVLAEMALAKHSEKLALACGILYSKEAAGAHIRIKNNLRMCGDCHQMMCLASKIYDGRKITVKDASRVHCFEQGVCSCENNW